MITKQYLHTWNRAFHSAIILLAALLIGLSAATAQTSTASEFSRPSRILTAAITENGRWIGYSVVRDDASQDRACITIKVTEPRAQATQVVGDACFNARQVYDSVDNLTNGPGTVVWLNNGTLLYVLGHDGAETLFRWHVGEINPQLLLRRDQVRLRQERPGAPIVVKASEPRPGHARARIITADTPQWGAQIPPIEDEAWATWSVDALGELQRSENPELLLAPKPKPMIATANAVIAQDIAVASPDRSRVAYVEEGQLGLDNPYGSYLASRLVVETQGERREILPFTRPRHWIMLLGWSSENALIYVDVSAIGSEVQSVSPSGRRRTILSCRCQLLVPGAANSWSGRAMDAGARQAILVRSSSTTADELIAVSLANGVISVLEHPNGPSDTMAGIEVRHYQIGSDPNLYGKLYLPPQFHRGHPLPLVITQYVARPGFYVGSGEELPVHSLLKEGIAVFAMHSREVNIGSKSGDFNFEMQRLRRPLQGMEWIIGQFVSEGVVDRKKVGLIGLSYGAEIVSYALFNSNSFCAVSVGSGFWHPDVFFLGGATYTATLRKRGFPDPTRFRERWDSISLGMNARASLAPLLIQSPDSEQNMVVPTYNDLVSREAPVEWINYADEGHIKSSPANKWSVFSLNYDWFRYWLKGVKDPDPAKAAQYQRWDNMAKAHQC